MIVMQITLVIFYLFMVSSHDHVIPVSHYRPTAQLMKDKDTQE